MNSYDNWLNRYNPYDDETDDTLEEHLEKMRAMDNEDDQRDYCESVHLKFHEIERHLLGS